MPCKVYLQCEGDSMSVTPPVGGHENPTTLKAALVLHRETYEQPEPFHVSPARRLSRCVLKAIPKPAPRAVWIGKSEDSTSGAKGLCSVVSVNKA